MLTGARDQRTILTVNASLNNHLSQTYHSSRLSRQNIAVRRHSELCLNKLNVFFLSRKTASFRVENEGDGREREKIVFTKGFFSFFLLLSLFWLTVSFERIIRLVGDAKKRISYE